MKQTIYLSTLLLLLFSACNNQPKNEIKEDEKQAVEIFKTLESGDVCYSIGDHYAGEFIIGDEIPKQEYLEYFEVRKEVLIKKTEEGEEEETVFVISKDGTDFIHLYPGTKEENGEQLEIIREILILSEKFKTSEGISVQSTIEEFTSKYSSYSIWYTYVSDNYIMEAEGFSGYFLLSGDDCTKEIEITSDMEKLEKSDFKADAKIVSIVVL